MKIERSIIALFIMLSITGNANCDDHPPLKGQSNATLTFYGLAVDQDGQPLQGVVFSADVEAIPPDWTFDTRGKPHLHSTIIAKSGTDGRFQLQITGHILRFENVERSGYRHFFDLATGASDFDNMAYMLNAWSDLYYRTDVDHPAVYVFVREGTGQVVVLPCRGGYDSYGGKQWTQNKPGWPTKPSLENIVYKPPATQPR